MHGYADLFMAQRWGLVGFDIVVMCAKLWGCGSFICGVILVTVMMIIWFDGVLAWLNFEPKCRVLGLLFTEYYALRLH